MKKLALLAFIVSLPLHASHVATQSIPTAYPWFVSIGTGMSWSHDAGITRPDANWDPADQGYDNDLGHRGFYTFSVGKQLSDNVDVSLSYLNHETFSYQKFQTGDATGVTGATGNSRTRFFDLSNRALLANLFVHTSPMFALGMDVSPFVSFGMGMGHNDVRNFHTVGTVGEGDDAVGSTGSIGSAVSENSFAWQGSIGINIHPQLSRFSVDVGYRYFDGGKFEGPSTVYTNTAGWSGGKPWTGRLKADQVFVDFKYSV